MCWWRYSWGLEKILVGKFWLKEWDCVASLRSKDEDWKMQNKESLKTNLRILVIILKKWEGPHETFLERNWHNSFTKCLLSTYYVPDTLLGARNSTVTFSLFQKKKNPDGILWYIQSANWKHKWVSSGSLFCAVNWHALLNCSIRSNIILISVKKFKEKKRTFAILKESTI